MATSGRFSGTLSKGSEELYDFCCSPCSKDGAVIEAVYQCIDCNEYYCVKCIEFHKKFNATSGHKVLGNKEMKQVKSSKPKKSPPPSQMCQEHGGDRFSIYCSDHDVVCCNTGVSVSHKNCDGTAYIVTAAEGIKSSKQLQSTTNRISSTLKDVKREKSSLQHYLADLDKDKTSNIKQVQSFAERLIKRIRDLERADIEAIDSKHKELKAGVNKGLVSMDDVISVLEGDLHHLDHSNATHEAQVFVEVKLGQRHEVESLNLLKQFNKPRISNLQFLLKSNIYNFLKDLNSLGSFADDGHVYQVIRKSNYIVKVRQDTETCDIGGSCQLPNGTVLLTDWNNRCIKRIDDSYRVTDVCNMPCHPWAVACTPSDEVAVTLTNQKKVQFVSVKESMTLSRSFRTSDACRGIGYKGGQLYVACGGSDIESAKEGPGHVVIYTLKGVQLNKIQTYPSGQNVFYCPHHITAANDGDKVYVAHHKRLVNHVSVVVLDRNGTILGTITDHSLIYGSGLCTLDNGHILVCGRDSNNVLQFDGDGRKVTELVKFTDGIKETQSLCYDSRNSRLIVTMFNTDNVKVFDLK